MKVSKQIIDLLIERDQSIAIAESLTAGLLMATLVEVPGSSAVVGGGVVTYSPDAKIQVLGVNAELIAADGTVNAEVAEEMAVKVRDLFSSDYAISTTGVAGPGPFEGRQPGTVFVGIATPAGVESFRLQLSGGRNEVRRQCVEHALERILATLSS